MPTTNAHWVTRKENTENMSQGIGPTFHRLLHRLQLMFLRLKAELFAKESPFGSQTDTAKKEAQNSSPMKKQKDEQKSVQPVLKTNQQKTTARPAKKTTKGRRSSSEKAARLKRKSRRAK